MKRGNGLTDCHVHIERGPYTAAWTTEFVKTAQARGIGTLYLLEHSHRFVEFTPLYTSMCAFSPEQKAWFSRRNALRLSEYAAFVECMRALDWPIRLRFGLEICYEPGQEAFIRSLTADGPFDFLTGSVHWVDGFAFDHHPEWWEGVDVDRTFRRYFALTEQLVASGLFTGLGHPDLIRLYGHAPSFDPSGAYLRIAAALRGADMYAEQNGGAYLRGVAAAPGLQPDFLRVLQEAGVRLLTASDAHRPEDVGAHVAELSGRMECLKEE